MTYVYSVMWLGIAIMLFVMGFNDKKLIKMYLILAVYFLYIAVWWFISAVSELEMFHGALGWVFRAMTVFFIVVAAAYYFFVVRKNNKNQNDKKE